MRFTQQIIATFAPFSICANPMGNQLDVSGLLMTSEEAVWCGGNLNLKTDRDEECGTEHCQLTLGTYAYYHITDEVLTKYVNLKYYQRHPAAQILQQVLLCKLHTDSSAYHRCLWHEWSSAVLLTVRRLISLNHVDWQ